MPSPMRQRVTKSQKETTLTRAQHTIDNAVKARDDANTKLGTLESDTAELKKVYDDQYNALIASGASDADAKAACADSYTAYLEKKAEYDQLKENMSSLEDAVYEAQQPRKWLIRQYSRLRTP